MMEKRLVAMVAAAGGLVIGVAGVGIFMHAQAAIPNSLCPSYDAAADAKADAVVKQLHAHDHDQYVPHSVPSPFGDTPKPANAESAKDSSQ